MSTLAPAQLRTLATGWAQLFKSAVFAGIIGDNNHLGGYHISRANNPAGNYSITRPDDTAGNGPDNLAAAIDMSMSTPDMIECTRRLRAAYDNLADPRRKYLNAFNGWTGSGNATRYDVYAHKTKTASADHKFHVHLEIRRRYVNDPTAIAAILSILRGDTVDQYLTAIGVKTTESAQVAPTSPAYPGHVLKRGTTNSAALKKWQQRMIDRGWKSLGKADGDFGAKTESVVRRFQAVCKLQVDGIIGADTWPKPWTQPLGG